jgi:hypothetical protein
VPYGAFRCGGEAFGSCHGRVLEEEGREAGQFPSPMKKAD